ncbi:MAG: hypothetical protein QM791_02210 [Ferruginibacter sp.]
MTTCKIPFTALVLTVLFNCACSSQLEKPKAAEVAATGSIANKTDTSLNGLYTGLEYMGTSTDPVYPGKVFKSFHLGYLKIKGDSVFLDQNPIFVYRKDTSYSASDGGFYYYSGMLTKTDTTVLFNLKELFCDYCGELFETKPDGTKQAVKRIKQLKGRITHDGFLIDGYLYKRTGRNEELISEHPALYLTSE